jgi:response regulator RpfG family c-di-GMP phosphodiesterase
MSEAVLFVDDERSILEAIQRMLHTRMKVHTASNAAEGLQLVRESGPFALVVSDMRMPGMNGAQFLGQVRQLAPDTVRMILSGQADLESTIASVNESHIYRFLCKPCRADQLIAAIEDGLRQYRLITAEKVLLEQTLSGAVKMLIEILGMLSPTASNRAARLQKYVIDLAATLQLPDHWQWSLGACVSQIGCAMVPKEILAKVESAQALSDEERRLYESHPTIAGKLLATIPRLDDVAAIVTAQFGALSFEGKPGDFSQWDIRSAGQLLLRASVEFDRLLMLGGSSRAAVDALQSTMPELPSSVICALRALKVSERGGTVVREVCLHELAPGMTLDQDLVTLKGIRLVSSGQEITRTLMIKLASIAEGVGVAEPFRVRVQG